MSIVIYDNKEEGEMITDTFDMTTEAIISPDKFYGTHKALCDICIITLSNQIVAEIINQFECEKIAEIKISS